MIHFPAYTAAETRNAFQWVGQPPKLPISWGSRSHCDMWFLGPPWVTLQMASRSVEQYLQGSRTWPTERQTTLLHL